VRDASEPKVTGNTEPGILYLLKSDFLYTRLCSIATQMPVRDYGAISIRSVSSSPGDTCLSFWRRDEALLFQTVLREVAARVADEVRLRGRFRMMARTGVFVQALYIPGLSVYM
jgi:hypothetical protein